MKKLLILVLLATVLSKANASTVPNVKSNFSTEGKKCEDALEKCSDTCKDANAKCLVAIKDPPSNMYACQSLCRAKNLLYGNYKGNETCFDNCNILPWRGYLRDLGL